jgi:NADH-quinone oxidoreductase subunit L
VVAYSTLSQLGYMMVALGASAYAAGIFHLVTHAFFKALLFLAAGSVIIALHHEQDMRKMGGLKKYMPWTYWTALIGALALCGIPPFAGYFSKDAILEAVHESHTPGAGIAYAAVLSGVFVTALYTFRMMFMTFHGKERYEAHGAHAAAPHESPWVVTVPLVALAVPSIFAGWAYIAPLLFDGFFGNSLVVGPQPDPLAALAEHWHGPLAFALHGLTAPPFWLALAGVATAWYLYIRRPELPDRIAQRLHGLYKVLVNKYYFDDVYQALFAGGARLIGNGFWKIGDVGIIDGLFVNGSARVVGWFAGVIRQVQSGFIYHYAFMMIIGVLLLLTLWFARA